MIRIMMFFMFMTMTTLLACQNGCGKAMMNGGSACGTVEKEMKASASTIGTVKYALGIMGLKEHSDIRVALHEYKKSIRALPRGMKTDAFKNGAFDKDLYVQQSRKHQKLQAEIDLFDTIYLILDDKQKVRFHQLMAAHQHYMSLDNVNVRGCGTPGIKGDCGAKMAPTTSCCHIKMACQNCGPQGKCQYEDACQGKNKPIVLKKGAQPCQPDQTMNSACSNCGCQGQGTPGCQCVGNDGGICQCKDCKMDQVKNRGGMKCGPGKCGGGM